MRKLAFLILAMATSAEAAIITGGYIDDTAYGVSFKFTGPDNLDVEGSQDFGTVFPAVIPIPYAQPPIDSFETVDFGASLDDGGLVGYLGHGALFFQLM
jgi:hypothetical protein